MPWHLDAGEVLLAQSNKSTLQQCRNRDSHIQHRDTPAWGAQAEAIQTQPVSKCCGLVVLLAGTLRMLAV